MLPTISQETRDHIARSRRRIPPYDHGEEDDRRHRTSQASGDGVQAGAAAATTLRRHDQEPHGA